MCCGVPFNRNAVVLILSHSLTSTHRNAICDATIFDLKRRRSDTKTILIYDFCNEIESNLSRSMVQQKYIE